MHHNNPYNLHCIEKAIITKGQNWKSTFLRLTIVYVVRKWGRKIREVGKFEVGKRKFFIKVENSHWITFSGNPNFNKKFSTSFLQLHIELYKIEFFNSSIFSTTLSSYMQAFLMTYRNSCNKLLPISHRIIIFELFWMIWMVFVLAIIDSVYSENNMLGNNRKNFRGFFLFPILPWAIIKFQIGNRLAKLQGHVRTRPQTDLYKHRKNIQSRKIIKQYSILTKMNKK